MTSTTKKTVSPSASSYSERSKVCPQRICGGKCGDDLEFLCGPNSEGVFCVRLHAPCPKMVEPFA